MKWTQWLEEQKTVATILINSLEQSRLGHAYLFTGQKGTGKREVARHLARSFFCRNKNGIEPCGTCRDCRRIDSGNHPDVVVIRPDGRSIKKQQIADLIKAFSYRGVESERKFFIVEQVDLMTAQAANSLLKFMEEPDGQTVCVLITENVHAVLETIVSRCQVLTFKPLPPEKMKRRLIGEGVAPAMAATVTALTADYEEAKALAGDEWFAKARSVVINYMEELFAQPQRAMMTMYEQCATHFTDSNRLHIGLDLMLIWFRDVLSLQTGRPEAVVFTDRLERLNAIADMIFMERTASGLAAVLAAKRRLNANGHPLSVLEQLALRLEEGAVSHV
ncbi:DNA polymerase III subunit delta' [Caenibacillus caldisaponilyticus]|uniref:DNA polymerase III subunit delta' n=1 Tax=Caenibacillus caldisaponilyticus TaxID=1674942 RepID=UPI0009884CEE|nr:DNA polymerase III subunit delta' [Caenibacillus caldisaponilyticus]